MALSSRLGLGYPLHVPDILAFRGAAETTRINSISQTGASFATGTHSTILRLCRRNNHEAHTKNNCESTIGCALRLTEITQGVEVSSGRHLRKQLAQGITPTLTAISHCTEVGSV